MLIQRSYRLPHQSTIKARQIDCGVYLFLMTICGEHLGMLTLAVVHAAQPYLSWSIGMTATPMILVYLVRAHTSTVSLPCAVNLALLPQHNGTVFNRGSDECLTLTLVLQ